jgi:hypothetical protein
MGRHLRPVHLVFFLWISHNVFASSNVIGTLRLADVTYHTVYPVKDAQIVARRMSGISIIFFTLCICVLQLYNMSIFEHIA